MQTGQLLNDINKEMNSPSLQSVKLVNVCCASDSDEDSSDVYTDSEIETEQYSSYELSEDEDDDFDINMNDKDKKQNKTQKEIHSKSKLKGHTIHTIECKEIMNEFSSKIIKLTMKAIKDLYGDKIKKLTAQHYCRLNEPQQLTKQTNLMMSKQYAFNAGWNESDGFREMIQNWFDGCHHVINTRNWKYPSYATKIQPIIHCGKKENNLSYYFFLYDNSNGNEFDIKNVANNELLGCILLKDEQKSHVLKLYNYGISLDASQIIIGHTTKRIGSGTVGKFGEGLKMGACILLYYNHKFSILTNTKNWKFKFKKNARYRNATTMHVLPHQKELKSPAQVVVTIQNVKKKVVKLEKLINIITNINICDDIDRRNFFPLQPPPNDQHVIIQDVENGLDGNILFGNYYKNKIFVNGFYIESDEDLYFGYNINGNKLPLDRDRCLTGDSYQKLRELVPKYWKSAILTDSDLAKIYLESTNKGKPMFNTKI